MSSFPSPAIGHVRRTLGLFAFAALIAAAPAQAMEPIGEINGEIGGDSFAWETLDVPSEGTATAEFEAFGPVTTISIQGHEQGGESRMRNVISLDLSLMGEGDAGSIMDADISFFPDGLSGPFYISTDAPREAEISFDTLTLSDDAGMAEGSFTALLCRQDSFMTPPDLEDCIEANGRFSTRLRPRA
ncbi:MAG: hypothetical protein JJU21_08570 [Salinarimonas sp.]|nr:hypothetical protein [Salinarimonas sp.]